MGGNSKKWFPPIITKMNNNKVMAIMKPFKMEFDIESIMVVESSGADTILFNFSNIKNGCWPYTGMPVFKTEVAKGGSKKWLIENFGNNIMNHTTIVDTRAGLKKASNHFKIKIGDEIKCFNGSHGIVESCDVCTCCIILLDGDYRSKMHKQDVQFINGEKVEPTFDTILFEK